MRGRPIDFRPRPEDLAHEMSTKREIDRERASERVERGDPPWHHHTGIVAAVHAVRDLKFPLTNAQVRKQAGDRYVRATQKLTLPMAEVLAHMPEESFQGIKEFERAVQRHWAGIRYLEVPDEQRPRGG